VEEIQNPNVVKVVCDVNDQALYFSRSAIPFDRNGKIEGSGIQYYRHIGMYAFRAEALRTVAKLSPSALEKTEMLEQLRWLENGMGIGVKETTWASPAIDTPEDVAKALRFV
jgi:3-deoxy-manno-octulosonate cytidylyltransferase (CMP-KDO synthetase)